MRGASFRWSIHSNSAWGSIEPSTIGKTHPTLLKASQNEFQSSRISHLAYLTEIRHFEPYNDLNRNINVILHTGWRHFHSQRPIHQTISKTFSDKVNCTVFFIVLNAFLAYWRPIQLSLDSAKDSKIIGFFRDLAHSQSTIALIQHKKWYEKRFWVRDLIHLHVRELNHVHSIGR